jgi:hypothetical protein
VSVGEERHPGWVLEHPGRATREGGDDFVLPKAEDVPIYLRWGRIRRRFSGALSFSI